MTSRHVVATTVAPLCLVLATGAWAAAGPAGPMSVSDLAAINEAIEANGAQWMAGETSVSRLPRDQRLMRLGAIREEVVEAEASEPSPLGLPNQWDWRDVGGNNFMTAVRDQGNCGSCVAFGVIGALEAGMKVSNDAPDWNPNLSEQHLFSCGGGGCKRGWYVSSALNYVRNSGVPNESCHFYMSGLFGRDRDCSLSCSDWERKTLQVASWSYVSNNVESIKSAISESPVVTTMDIYQDFYAYTEGVYSHSWGNYSGGHCVTLVGWDESLDCWIARNSWGPHWGEAGYFRIAYGDSDIGSQTARVTHYPTIRVFADAEQVPPGGGCEIGVNLVNTGSRHDGQVELWVEGKQGGGQVYYAGAPTLEAGFEYHDASVVAFTDIPAQYIGEYTFYGAIRDRSGGETHSFGEVAIEVRE